MYSLNIKCILKVNCIVTSTMKFGFNYLGRKLSTVVAFILETVFMKTELSIEIREICSSYSV